MAIDCDPSTLANDARCFQSCIPNEMQQAIQTYLLAVIAGESLDPDTLLEKAKCFKCLDGMQAEVQSYLLCAIANLP